MIDRIIKLPEKKSFFLFGPRQTGKSTLIDFRFTESVWKIDLLEEETFFVFTKNPSLFRKQAIEKIENGGIKTIFIDEVQRAPALLNETQAIMRKYNSCRFILTGSSARKLKRGGANLLAGRAYERSLFPFTYSEIGDGFKLDDVLLYGALPPVIDADTDDKIEILSAYTNTYLREEIKNEGIARNVGGFSRFLDMAAYQSGELLNYSNIARECQIPKRTVQSYYEILEDTFIGFKLEPWRKSIRKRLSAHSKFYLFDTGVTNAINRRLTAPMDPQWQGKLFEQFIILETYRLINYLRSEANMFFWRTNHGSEVDILLEKHGHILGAFEIKSAQIVHSTHLSGLRSYLQENPDVPCFVISRANDAYKIGDIKIIPWRQYLETLSELLV